MIKMENIYYMLSYAYRNLQIVGTKPSNFEDFDNAIDLLANLLIKGVSSQVKRGMIKSYIPMSDGLSSPKGKIEIATTISKSVHMKKRLVCSYDEYSVNTLLNSILKSTLLVITKSRAVKPQNKKMARQLMIFFANVDSISLKDVAWSKIKFYKHNLSYRFIINLCYLISEVMLMNEGKGNHKHGNTVDDQLVSRLYEKFVLEYFKKHFPEVKTSASYIKWEVDGTMIDFLPVMKSDIMLKFMDKTLIIDTKYYSKTMQGNMFNDKKTYHSGNMYQIFTYVKNKDPNQTGNVQGMLLYAKTDEEVVPNQEFMMSGNMIHVKTLDLGCKFTEIEEQLYLIVSLVKEM